MFHIIRVLNEAYGSDVFVVVRREEGWYLAQQMMNVTLLVIHDRSQGKSYPTFDLIGVKTIHIDNGEDDQNGHRIAIVQSIGHAIVVSFA